MRKRFVFSLLVFIALVGAAVPANAIDRDRSWTHNENNHYASPQTDNPECQTSGGGQGCEGWDAKGFPHIYQIVQVVPNFGPQQFINDLSDAITNNVNPMAPTGGASAHSPVYTFNAGDGHQVVVQTGWPNSSQQDMCAWTQPQLEWRQPSNFGCCQERAIVGATVTLNLQKSFSDNGSMDPNTCEIRWLFNHELGHTLGLGHTVDKNQTMYPFNVAVYSYQNGDQNGIACINDQQNDPASCER